MSHGMHARTGRRLTGLQHLQQSVTDILTTPVGTRVMRRDYGSLLPELLDQPLNDTTRVRVYAAAVMALLRWEPRLRITSLSLGATASGPGQLSLGIEGSYADLPAQVEVLV